MYIKTWIRVGALAVTAALIGACAELSDEELAELGVEKDVELDTTSSALKLSDNGLMTLNGLTSLNGMRTLNGLTTSNGMKTVNGLLTINGLTTRNGMKTVNGLPVNCDGSKVPGTTCTGAPDGLLKLSGGLMSTDNGKMLASYLVKCALTSSQEVRVKDYAGNLVSMKGSIGLAPKWLGDSVDPDGLCGTPCEEKVSACLMAHSNRSGTQVPILLSGPQSVLGGSYGAYVLGKKYPRITEKLQTKGDVGKRIAGILQNKKPLSEAVEKKVLGATTKIIGRRALGTGAALAGVGALGGAIGSKINRGLYSAADEHRGSKGVEKKSSFDADLGRAYLSKLIKTAEDPDAANADRVRAVAALNTIKDRLGSDPGSLLT